MENNKKQQFAVIGDPIAHSLSPKMHNAAFRALDIDAEYKAIRVPKDELSEFADFAKKNLGGFNVTVPHKENIIPFLDEISDLCKMTGSVNTVINRNGALYGDSTDGYGLEKAIEESFNIKTEGTSFLFIGCGGTVKAVAFHLLQQRAKRVFIANRTVEKAEKLAEELSQSGSYAVKFCALSDKKLLSRYVDSADVIIQATSLGLKDDDPSPFPEELIKPGVCMFDIVYKRTQFIKDAEKHHIPHAGGGLMLVHQGAKSFSLWTGIPAPLDVMKEAVLK